MPPRSLWKPASGGRCRKLARPRPAIPVWSCAMRDVFEGYVVRWLALLEAQPSHALGQAVSDLAASPEADRPALARRFAALLYGPRVDPDRVRLLMGQLAGASGQAA